MVKGTCKIFRFPTITFALLAIPGVNASTLKSDPFSFLGIVNKNVYMTWEESLVIVSCSVFLCH